MLSGAEPLSSRKDYGERCLEQPLSSVLKGHRKDCTFCPIPNPANYHVLKGEA